MSDSLLPAASPGGLLRARAAERPAGLAPEAAGTPGVRGELEPLERRLARLEEERARDQGAPGVLRALRARRRQAERVALEIDLEAVEARCRIARRAADTAVGELRRRRGALAEPLRRAEEEARGLEDALRLAEAQRRRAGRSRAARARAAREAARVGMRRGREEARLKAVPLAEAPLAGVTAEQRAALERHGLRTAADLHEARLMEVPELDPAAALQLLRWRWSLAAQVRPDPEAERRAERGAARRDGEEAGGAVEHAGARCAELRERQAAVAKELAPLRARVAAELARSAGELRELEREEGRARADLAAVGALLARLRALG